MKNETKKRIAFGLSRLMTSALGKGSPAVSTESGAAASATSPASAPPVTVRARAARQAPTSIDPPIHAR